MLLCVSIWVRSWQPESPLCRIRVLSFVMSLCFFNVVVVVGVVMCVVVVDDMVLIAFKTEVDIKNQEALERQLQLVGFLTLCIAELEILMEINLFISSISIKFFVIIRCFISIHCQCLLFIHIKIIPVVQFISYVLVNPFDLIMSLVKFIGVV